MDITINRNLLMHNINYVNYAVSGKPQMPILSGIKITATNEGVSFIASNSNTSIKATIAASQTVQINKTGEIVIPGRYFYEIIRKCEDEFISITTFEETSAKIISGKTTFTLNLLDKDIYPTIPFEGKGEPITMDALNLKQIIKKTAFATSESESKMVLTGVNFKITGNKFEAVATDSYRLAKKYMSFETNSQPKDAIVPSKSLDALYKVMSEDQELVKTYVSRTQVLVKYKNVSFKTRLIEGKFPIITSLIPEEFIANLKFDKKTILGAVDRASLFSAADLSSVIKLTITNTGEVIIQSQTNEVGGSVEKIKPLTCDNNINFETAFSAKYFYEAVKAFESSDITIHFTGEIKPIIITSDYDVNHIQLILPVRR